MSKTVSKFALAASVALAMAFTFSCSGDDDKEDNPGGGMDLSNLPPQNLIFDGQLEGKIDVFLRIWRDDGAYEDHGDKYDRLSAGKIENRKLSLSLPQSMPSKYLDESWDCYNEEDNCQLSVAPQSLAYAYGTLIVPTLHQGRCEYWVTELPASITLEWRVRCDD